MLHCGLFISKYVSDAQGHNLLCTIKRREFSGIFLMQISVLIFLVIPITSIVNRIPNFCNRICKYVVDFAVSISMFFHFQTLSNSFVETFLSEIVFKTMRYTFFKISSYFICLLVCIMQYSGIPGAVTCSFPSNGLLSSHILHVEG